MLCVFTDVLCVQSVEEILRCYSKDENPDLNRQIQFIIKQLNSGQFSQIHCYDVFIALQGRVFVQEVLSAYWCACVTTKHC